MEACVRVVEDGLFYYVEERRWLFFWKRLSTGYSGAATAIHKAKEVSIRIRWRHRLPRCKVVWVG